MPLTEQLIRKKREGLALSSEEIRGLVEGITSGAVSDSQIAALAMAIFFRGLSDEELGTLTRSMRDSGTVLHWCGLDGPVLDKHSTGGVGDLVSLVVGPLVAACGAFVPMISGRGLGHTGGTVDKLESIPGLQLFPASERFQRQVRQIGVAIVGQSAEFAPADGRIYAVRDATATVDSIPLIVSSILAKKLAEGLEGLVMDIKCGNGAFMRDVEQARQLAGKIGHIAAAAGVRCRSVLTDMGQPLAWSAGNAVEVAEAIGFLTGDKRHPRLVEVISAVASDMLLVGDIHQNRRDAQAMVSDRLASGAAADKFAAMVCAQGGSAHILEQHRDILPRAEVIKPVFAGHSGFVSGIDTQAVGVSVVELGGGRKRPGDPVDPAVGLSDLIGLGDAINPDRPLAMVHARSEDDWARAALTLKQAYQITDVRPLDRPVILQS